MTSLKNRNLPFIWGRIKNRPWGFLSVGWIKLEAESCFWDGDKQDKFKKGNSQRLCSISAVLRNDWEQMEWMRGCKSDSLGFQLFSTSDLQSKKCHHVSAGSLGQKSYCSVIHRCFGSSFSMPTPGCCFPCAFKVHLIPVGQKYSVLNVIWNFSFFWTDLVWRELDQGFM